MKLLNTFEFCTNLANVSLPILKNQGLRYPGIDLVDFEIIIVLILLIK